MQEIHGTVWGADQDDRYVVLHSAGAAPGQTCLHVVNRATLASTVCSSMHPCSTPTAPQDGVAVLEPPPQQPLPTLHTLCPQRTAERLEKALKVRGDSIHEVTFLHNRPQAAEQEAARVGDGVSVLAQHMYDAINKTMPCSWDGSVIVVLDEVRVAPPYTPETCATKNPRDTVTMQRVQKVVRTVTD